MKKNIYHSLEGGFYTMDNILDFLKNFESEVLSAGADSSKPIIYYLPRQDVVFFASRVMEHGRFVLNIDVFGYKKGVSDIEKKILESAN